jgi:dihydrofolate synthase/folylpolyglutamate synthase
VTIRNLAEAEAALLSFVPLVSQLTGKDTTLDRVWPLMELAGNPQDKLRVIHIAGTSGKTSTAYYMAAILTAAGAKTGLTVSPHVDNVLERVQINAHPLDEATFCNELGEFLDIVERAEQKPSYFELLYTFALWEFERQGVDYAVVETGIGGLHDATNVTRRSDKVCILTDIGHDHMHILGHSLTEIATQKIGIVHQGNTVFTYQPAPEVAFVYKEWCRSHGAVLNIVPEPSEPGFQRRNWNLAREVYNFICQRDNISQLGELELERTILTIIPGRMDIKKIGSKTLIMDGAHNYQKMDAFIESYHQLFPGSKPAVMLAFKQSKDYADAIDLVAELADHIILTTFNTTQDLPAKSAEPDELAKAFKNVGKDAEVIPDQVEAYRSLLVSPQNELVITGSFYLLSQIRNNKNLV